MMELANIHPGEVLLDEFLKPMELSQTRLANAIGVPPRRINEIVLGKRAVSADTAVRLARCLIRVRGSGWGCRQITIWRRCIGIMRHDLGDE
ncbi:HigA family addiction module antitoxin [Salinisphaera sp. SPP-AMP-43]